MHPANHLGWGMGQQSGIEQWLSTFGSRPIHEGHLRPWDIYIITHNSSNISVMKCNKNKFMVGGTLNMRYCIKGLWHEEGGTFIGGSTGSLTILLTQPTVPEGLSSQALPRKYCESAV